MEMRGKAGAGKGYRFRLAEFGGVQEDHGGLPLGQLIQRSLQGQSVGSAGHPSGHRRDPALPRRPQLGPPPVASHDGPTMSHGLGDASPGAGMEQFMRVGLGERKTRGNVGREVEREGYDA